MLKSILLIAGATLATAQFNITKSVVAKAADPKYTIDYTVDYTNTANPSLVLQLKIENLDVSTWTATNGSQGLWVSLGWNTDEMDNADAAICLYYYRNAASDTFICSDFKADAEGNFNADTINNIMNVSTITGAGFRRTTNTVVRGNFTVQFSRLFMTGDTAQDTIIRNKEFDVIYAVGSIVGSAPVQHTFSGVA